MNLWCHFSSSLLTNLSRMTSFWLCFCLSLGAYARTRRMNRVGPIFLDGAIFLRRCWLTLTIGDCPTSFFIFFYIYYLRESHTSERLSYLLLSIFCHFSLILFLIWIEVMDGTHKITWKETNLGKFMDPRCSLSRFWWWELLDYH